MRATADLPGVKRFTTALGRPIECAEKSRTKTNAPAPVHVKSRPHRGLTWHSSTCRSALEPAAGQSWPGLTTLRVRTCLPPPQPAVHTDHGDHSESLQPGVIGEVAAAVARAVSAADGVPPALAATVGDDDPDPAATTPGAASDAEVEDEEDDNDDDDDDDDDNDLSRRASAVGIGPATKTNAAAARATAAAATRLRRRRRDETGEDRRTRILGS